MTGPFYLRWANEVDAIHPGVMDHLEALDKFPEPIQEQVVAKILSAACMSTHMGNIMTGRKLAKRIPSELLRRTILTTVDNVLDLEDYWDYRRLLELIEHCELDILDVFTKRGLSSIDPDVREAAEDFR